MDAATTAIKYIGRHETHTDNIYGTGTWSPGEVKGVSHDLGARMAKHVDAYVVTKGAKDVKPAPNTNDADSEEQGQIEQLQTQVNGMNKAALIDFAKTHYGKKIDGRTSAADARTEVMRLIDQYGPQ